MTLNQIRREVSRVFDLSSVDAETTSLDQIRVMIPGEDVRIFRTGQLISVLRRFPAGHGMTEDGVCDVLSAAADNGAFVSVA